MSQEFTCSIKSVRFDENYQPADNTRLTTNFANLARGEHRQENLRRTLEMINNRFNTLASCDNPNADRYSLEIDIISAELDVEGNGKTFPFIETLKSTIIDHKTNERIEGMIGNSFSSYVRDYDFSVVLPELGFKTNEKPENFGDLHGKLYQHLVNSEVFKAEFKKQPVICLSVSTSKTYYRTANVHPVLGVEYKNDEYSRTDDYFKKMGLSVRYFKPENATAPLAFYSANNLLTDYTDFELISAISTMESFQKIYRPEIYNTNSVAGLVYQPSLNFQDFSLTRIVYDRVERSQLAVKQGKWTEENFIKPYKDILEQWAANFAAENTKQEHAA
ncbi:putative oxygenase MesX [Acinetobacter sp. CWB-B33]|uniref:putative oxygenase MesX n=1 Tax=Acinetobacter sp. CWB-B33 TaxID=2815724 RepID=UPI0031FE4D93